MVKVDITKISSKGQVVIPKDLRYDFKEGDKLLVIRDGDRLILRKADKLDKNFAEDIEFARRTELRINGRVVGLEATHIVVADGYREAV